MTESAASLPEQFQRKPSQLRPRRSSPAAGADYKINERFALRFKADYLDTHTSFVVLGNKTQDNLRLSVGVVIRSVRKKRRNLEEEPTE